MTWSVAERFAARGTSNSQLSITAPGVLLLDLERMDRKKGTYFPLEPILKFEREVSTLFLSLETPVEHHEEWSQRLWKL